MFHTIPSLTYQIRLTEKRKQSIQKFFEENSELVDNGFKSHGQESTCGESDDT